MLSVLSYVTLFIYVMLLFYVFSGCTLGLHQILAGINTWIDSAILEGMCVGVFKKPLPPPQTDLFHFCSLPSAVLPLKQVAGAPLNVDDYICILFHDF